MKGSSFLDPVDFFADTNLRSRKTTRVPLQTLLNNSDVFFTRVDVRIFLVDFNIEVLFLLETFPSLQIRELIEGSISPLL